MDSRVLLIVDDDKHVVDILSRFFSSCHYSIHTAGTCADAIRLAGLYHPDCLLLDFHLLDGKGDKVCRAVRADMQLKHTPIVMLSVDPTRELDSYLEYRADAFILKGSSLEKIRAVVEGLLRRVRWERRILTCGDLHLVGSDFSVHRDSRLIAQLSADQFCLFFLLLEKAGEFVSEEIIVECVLQNDPMLTLDKGDAIRSLICRLRKKLGVQLGRRIRNSRNKGWIYLPPRDRKGNVLPKCSEP